LVECATGALRRLACDFKGLFHQAQGKWNQVGLANWKLYGANVPGTDFPKGPPLEEPFRAVRQFILPGWIGLPHRLAVRAQLNVMQDYPPCALDAGREPDDIEQGPGMTVIGIDEGQAKFFPCSDFTNKIRAVPRVHSHGGGKVRNQPGNLKTRRSRFLDDALTAEVDRLHYDFIPASVLPINGRGDYCRGKAGQRSNLNGAARRENTHEGSEKKIILPTNSSRMPGVIELRHRVEKIQFPGGRSFSNESQEIRQGRILGLKLFERRNCAEIEAFAINARPRAGQIAPQFPNDLETAAPGRGSKRFEMTRGWKFQMRYYFSRSTEASLPRKAGFMINAREDLAGKVLQAHSGSL
jgi:hypothetical protein